MKVGKAAVKVVVGTLFVAASLSCPGCCFGTEILKKNLDEANALGTVQSNCQRLTTINYHYSRAYRLPDMDTDKTDVGITFNFSVRAVSDGHLRLSSTPEAKQSTVTIEIVLGAGANTFSAVRRKPKKSPTDYSVNTNQILSDKELRPFALVLKEGTLTLYANNSNFPLLVYEDFSVTDMEYISFGAWNNVAVEWSFDCRDAEVPEPLITNPLVKLRRKYWANYDPFNPPVLDNSTLDISVSMAIIRVNLDFKLVDRSLIRNKSTQHLSVKREIFYVLLNQINTSEISPLERYAVLIKAIWSLFQNAKTSEFTDWTDQKLQWNPEEYENITHLNLKHRVIWMPEFELLDVPKADTSILEDRTVRLYHSGAVRWKSLGEVQTWCDVDVTDWPSDTHVCDLHIGLRFHPETVRVLFTENKTPLELETSASEWEIVSITSSIMLKTDEAPPQSFKLRITLKRSAGFYALVFVIPLFVAFIMLIMSFITAPQHRTRLTLVSAAILTLHVLLYMEDALLPALPLSTPRIMKTTSSLLIMAILQLIFHCFNVHIAKFEIPPPQIVKTVAKKSWMKHLHQATYEVFLSEDKQDDTPELSETVDTNDDGPEQPEGINMNKYHWTLVSRGLDMLTFTLSFLILPFLLAPL